MTVDKLTRESFVESLRKCDGRDPEDEHWNAEQLMLIFLRDLGYGDIADAWKAASAKWWYA